MGELAALFTSVAWSFTSLQFTLAGRRVGSPVVNRTRLALAAVFLALAHLLLTGALWPQSAAPARWFWLGISGIIGLVLGDACLFQAYVLIGPRRAMLLMVLSPILSSLLAWLWLGEALTRLEIFAMLVALAGVAWVTTAPRTQASNGVAVFAGDHDHRAYLNGVLLGVGAALGQALGLLLAKQGMAGGFSTISATLMRISVALATIVLVTLAQGQVRATLTALRDQTAFRFILGGAFTGPFLGIWGSMIAVQNAPLGVASTLLALPPVLLIPLMHWVFHEQITRRAVVGTLVALTGAALLFLQ